MRLQQALDLAAKGFSVFPIKPGAKFPPLLAGWPTRATNDADMVRSFWSAVPDANIGIHAAGLVVLDVDVRSGGDESLEFLTDIHPLPATLTARTPTGGRHLYFSLPDGHPGVSNSAGKLGPGLDVKTSGGYLVAPGSTTEAGEYTFEYADMTVAPAPDWLLAQLGLREARQRDVTPVAAIPPAPPDSAAQARSWLAGQPVGEGAFATACGLRDRGLSLDQALEAMAAHDPRPNVPEKVRHAYAYAQNEPGARVALPTDFEVVEAAPRGAAKGAPSMADLLAGSNKRRPYLVKGLLQQGSHAVMYGAPGEGKSFLALDIAYHVAAGRPWMDRKVHQGSVIYLAFEGYGGLTDRLRALKQQYGAAAPLYIDNASYNLRVPEGCRALAAVIAATNIRPVLVVIDTLAQALKGADENSASDMGQMNTAVNELIKASGACVLLVHHSGKNKNAGARGSSALLGAIDTEIEISERRVRPSKQRDIALCDPIGFALQSMVVDIDEDGDDITSCVVVPDTIQDSTDGLPRISGNARHGFDVLCDMAPDNVPVDVSEWREACGEAFLDGKKVSQRFYDLLRVLRTKGYVLVEKGKARRRLE